VPATLSAAARGSRGATRCVTAMAMIAAALKAPVAMPTRRPAIAAPWRGDDNGGGGLRGRQLVPATEPSQAKRAAAAVKLTGPAANTAADW
jgi:hypothetical protein